MKKITLILIFFTTFASQSFAHCPIPQWCPTADLHQVLCAGQAIDDIEFPSVIGQTLIINWWTDGTRFASINTPDGITVSGPPENREHSSPVIIRGTPTAPGTHHYTVSNTCGVELLHGSITLAGSPTIGTVTPTIDQATPQNIAFDSTLTLTDDPIGSMPPITIQWYSSTTASSSAGASGTAVSGATGKTFAPPVTTINTTGVYYYAVATDRCGSTTATNNTSGRHTIIHPIPVCAATTNPTPSDNRCSPTRDGTTFTGIGTQYFKTSTTWAISGRGISQEWSDVVLTSTCGKTGFAGGSDPNFNNDCRQNRITGTNETRPTAINQGENTANYFGDLFSWCAVMTHATVLCPDDWRVPTCQDFINLDIALGGTGIDRSGAAAVRNKLIDVSGTSGAGQFWGGAYVGSCSRTGTLTTQGSYGVYWSSSEATTANARYWFFDTGGRVFPQDDLAKNRGLALRCVRDVP
ncbi:MAG: fibrobacter succinogenes major paralogous domain-containing protein [Bacteroidales bacterium]|nr:fibrobacter succinogenes major paralogous domain-containing protein [Bacteroidales bacterium]